MPQTGRECIKRSYLVRLFGSEFHKGSMDVSVPNATHISFFGWSRCWYDTGLVTVVGDWIRTEYRVVEKKDDVKYQVRAAPRTIPSPLTA